MHSLLGLIGLVVLLCASIAIGSGNKHEFYDYGVLIDAGSTGTRVWVYRWPRQHRPSVTLPPIEPILSHKVKTRLADCASDPVGLRDAVTTLIRTAETEVPKGLRSTTSVYLLATAGMRFLYEDKAISVIEELDSIFKNTSLNPFLYDSPHSARILSGEEEGVFGWIAVNYLSGRLLNNNSVLYRTTSGILELGGASTQIAFIPRGSVLSDKFPVSIGGEKYPIYVHSYLHYGQEYVDVWIQKELKKRNDSPVIQNPCMLVGEHIFSASVNRTFNGTGDPSGCVDLLKNFIHKTEHCHPKPCAIGTVHQPKVPSNQTFYAIGAFVFILRDLNVISATQGGTFTPAQTYEAAFKFCSKNFEDLKRELNATQRNENFISKPCSIGLYMSLLFTRGYGFDNYTQQIIAAETINGQPIDWTLGALIYENDNRMSSQCLLEQKNNSHFKTRNMDRSMHPTGTYSATASTLTYHSHVNWTFSIASCLAFFYVSNLLSAF